MANLITRLIMDASQYDGGLQVLEIIVVTHEIAQVNDCVIRDNGSLKGGIQADFSSFF